MSGCLDRAIILYPGLNVTKVAHRDFKPNHSFRVPIWSACKKGPIKLPPTAPETPLRDGFESQTNIFSDFNTIQYKPSTIQNKFTYGTIYHFTNYTKIKTKRRRSMIETANGEERRINADYAWDHFKSDEAREGPFVCPLISLIGLFFPVHFSM